jgi:uncharacterized membrane protein YhaH (DUF805 family)
MVKVKPSKRTQHCRKMYWIFNLAHFLALFGPFAYYIPYCFIKGENTEKIAVGLSVLTSIILLVMAFIIDVKHRNGLNKTAFWILILGVIYVLNSVNITILVCIMAVISIIDELVFIKLRDLFMAKLNANKEIDRRLDGND